MIVGQTLFRLAGGSYYSPQFSRGGNAGVFTIEVFQVAGTSPELVADVEHKNAADTTWSVLDSFTGLSGSGVYTINAGAIKEQLRFKFSVGGTVATNAVSFNVLAPQWRPY